MSTVKFSVPEDIKQHFNQTFEGQNKSEHRQGPSIHVHE